MTTPKRLRAVKDRRTTWYRRHCELADAFAKDLGDKLSAADQALASHAATVTVQCEMLKVSQLNGETVDIDDVVRLTGALTRIRTELGKRAGAAKADDGLDWDELQRQAAEINAREAGE
jgi:hypothetical protein